MSAPVPSPGSDEAVKQGCICPVLDNGHGRGYLGGMKDANGNTLYVTVSDCPLHVPPTTANAPR